MTDQLKELIERLEKAPRPNRELDAAIRECVVGLRMYESIYERGGDLCLRYYPTLTGPSYHRLPRYTGSIDDALTLVPGNYEFEIGSAKLIHVFWAKLVGNGTGEIIGKGAPTPALAICIAALKARVNLRDASNTTENGS